MAMSRAYTYYGYVSGPGCGERKLNAASSFFRIFIINSQCGNNLETGSPTRLKYKTTTAIRSSLKCTRTILLHEHISADVNGNRYTLADQVHMVYYTITLGCCHTESNSIPANATHLPNV